MIDEHVYPEALPDWPFDEDACPVCANLMPSAEDKLTARLRNLRSNRANNT
jgi:hypothetical protein